MKRFLSVILTLSVMCTAFAVTAKNNEHEELSENEAMLLSGTESSYTNVEILTEVAYAFDRQGAQILYDMKNARRSIYSTPEDATAQRTIFLDCSSFVNSCYRNAFGVNVMPYEIGATGTSPSTANFDSYAKNNTDATDVVGYWVNADYTTDEARQEVVDWIYANLEAGDVLNYRKGNTTPNAGHVYLYLGNETFIHCAGAGSYVANTTDPSLSYDDAPSEVTSGGVIGTISAYNIFENTEHSRYIFNSSGSSKVFSFGIIRPLARGLTPTEDALERMAIKGLSQEKTASICENGAVNSGDIITYTVTLENTSSSDISGVTVIDTIPAGTELVSTDDGITVDGASLSWNGTVAAKNTVKISYSVKVTANTPGALIISNDTYVSGLKLGSITHSVSGYNSNQLALTGSKALEYAASGTAFDDGLALANAVYKDTFGADIINHSTASDALDELIDTENRTIYTTTEASRMIAPNLYGGRSIMYGWLYLPSENEKTRLPKKEHLSVGDIILADWSGGEDVYIYAGDSTLVTVENGTAKVLTIGDDIYTPGVNILISLLGYDRYAVLRPSMVGSSELDIASIAVTTAPTKTEYLTGDTFEADGMKVTATLTDGSEKEVYGYTVSPSVLVYGTDKVTVSFGDLSANVDVTVSSDKTITSVSEARNLTVGTVITVEGYVAGVASEGQDNDTELLLKDINSDTVIAVRNIPYGSYPDFGYDKGDRIIFEATVQKDTSPSTSYNYTKLYLDFSSENGTKESTIVSSGNILTYNFNNVVSLDTWSVVKSQFKTSKMKAYTYVKFPAGSYLNLYNGSYDKYYRVHTNPDAAVLADIKPDGSRSLSLLDKAMKQNIGDNWTSLFFDELTTGYPGTYVDREYYALYIGGNSVYYQLVILEENWIGKAPTQTVTVTLDLEREEDTVPYYSETYDNRAKMNIYTEEGGELIDTIVLETETASGSQITADISLSTGTYHAEIVKNGYKKHCLDLTLTSDAVLDPIKLISGDITASEGEPYGDGTVDIDDFIRVLRGFAQNASTDVRMRVDINEDGNVNVADLALVKSNFGK